MKNYTDLNIILDRSGSMETVASDMEGGLKSFLDAEKGSSDQTVVSLFTFDHLYDTVFVDKNVNDVEDIKLSPRGRTALTDAIGKTIDSVGEKLSNMKEEDRPNRVLFFIITDGKENASKKYTFEQVKEKLKHQRDVYAWDFTFLGVNEDDVMNQSSSLGINAESARGYVNTSKGIADAFLASTCSYSEYKKLDRSNPLSRSITFQVKEDKDLVGSN